MQALGYRLYQRIDGELTEIDATTVDFSAYSKDRFPFIIRQDPGEANALGRIKFVMPNRDDGSSCMTRRIGIRSAARSAPFHRAAFGLNGPSDLLGGSLQRHAGLEPGTLRPRLGSGATQGATLARAIPVRLHYDTVMVEAGSVVDAPGCLRA
jgi:murein L,D-transpeptidase YcbB/YkuD